MTAPSVATANPIEIALRRMGRTLKSFETDGNTKVSARALLLDLKYAVESSGYTLRDFPATFRQLYDSATELAKDLSTERAFVITSVFQTLDNAVKDLAKA